MPSDEVVLTGDQFDAMVTQKPDVLAGRYVAGSDHDPDATGNRKPPVGWHLMIAENFTIAPNYECKWHDQPSVFGQLRVVYRIPKGQPQAGCTLTAKFPFPYSSPPPMPAWASNQVCHWLKRLGLEVPAGMWAPAGWTPKAVIGKGIYVLATQYKDRDTNQTAVWNGVPDVQIALYGFKSIAEMEADRKAASAAGATNKNGGRRAAGSTIPAPTGSEIPFAL